MTLTTRIAVDRPVPVRELLDYVNTELLHAKDAKTYDEPGRIGNNPGQGFDAWVWIRYGEDGPLYPEPEMSEGRILTPACALVLSFDTAYGYSEGRAQCGDLHASYIARLVRWFDEHHTGWKWCLEGTGEWYEDLDGIDRLGNHELVAS